MNNHTNNWLFRNELYSQRVMGNLQSLFIWWKYDDVVLVIPTSEMKCRFITKNINQNQRTLNFDLRDVRARHSKTWDISDMSPCMSPLGVITYNLLTPPVAAEDNPPWLVLVMTKIIAATKFKFLSVRIKINLMVQSLVAQTQIRKVNLFSRWNLLTGNLHNFRD